MLVTPLQMALVAATIANGGVEPKPYLVAEGHRAGRLHRRAGPAAHARPRDQPQTAAELNQMMQLVVQGGTGTAARSRASRSRARPAPRSPARATSTTRGSSCFAPASNPQVAVAVVVEKQPNGFGGAVAAPIAKAILENLLHG